MVAVEQLTECHGDERKDELGLVAVGVQQQHAGGRRTSVALESLGDGVGEGAPLE